MSKEKDERNRLKDEFEQIQSEGGDFDFSTHLAKVEDLPDFGEIEIYDYESDLIVANQQSTDVLETLVDLYLGDVPKLKEHPYIKNKMKDEDYLENQCRRMAVSIYFTKLINRG